MPERLAPTLLSLPFQHCTLSFPINFPVTPRTTARVTASAVAPVNKEKANDAVTVPSYPARVILKGLRADRFRHPLDQQITEQVCPVGRLHAVCLSQNFCASVGAFGLSLLVFLSVVCPLSILLAPLLLHLQLRLLPGLEWGVRQAMRVLEEAVYIDNISSAILVGPTQMPSLHSSLVEAASILDLPVLPELYIKQSPVPNAYCMAIQGRRPFIVMHTSLLDLLSPAEVQVVLAHELSHIKCEHGVFITAANALALGLYSLGGSLGRVLGDRLSSLLYAWLRAAEFSCDRGALLVSQDLDTVLSALLKLVGGSQQLAGQLSTEAFLQQARSYDQAVGSPLGRLIKSQMEPGLTHPLPVLRVRELERWYKSDMYTGIIARGSRRAAETGQDGGIEGAGGDRRGQDGGERKGGSGAETV